MMPETTHSNQKKEILTMIAIIAVYFVVVSIPVLIFTTDKIRCEAGLLVGCVISIGMMFHMRYVIDKGFHMESGQAAFMAINSAGRLIIVLLLILVMAYTGIVNPFTMLAGLFSLKLSAYLQPMLLKNK